jgi:hypothetical protein
VERAVTQPDSALVQLRSDYRRLNDSFETSFAFRFGRGGGFCAEMLGLVKSMMTCLHRRTQFCLSRGGPPTGIGVVNGFADYFEPLFPEIDAGIFNALNLETIRGSGRFPILRRGASRLLRAATGAEFFMMDDLGALPPRLVVPELGIDAEYADACALLVRLVWIYRPDVQQEVMRTVSDWGVPDCYVSVHVRRGDKHVESAYVALDRYVAAIDRARRDGCAVVVASDDGSAADELARLLPPRFQVAVCSAPGSGGFRQSGFNRLPAPERYRQVKRFLAELEVLRRGALFVGAASSNVTYLIEMMRAGRGVLRVG